MHSFGITAAHSAEHRSERRAKKYSADIGRYSYFKRKEPANFGHPAFERHRRDGCATAPDSHFQPRRAHKALVFVVVARRPDIASARRRLIPGDAAPPIRQVRIQPGLERRGDRILFGVANVRSALEIVRHGFSAIQLVDVGQLRNPHERFPECTRRLLLRTKFVSRFLYVRDQIR